VEGDPSDPESWNRYAYARDNPVNLVDPSGQFSLFDIFKLIGLVSADILTSGATTEATLPTLVGDFEGLISFAEEANLLSQEGQQKQQPPQLPPALRLPQPPPDIYTQCSPVLFTITGVGPHQAPHRAAGFPPANGTAAYHPQDFGLSNSQAKQLDRSTTPIVFQPDWSEAQIPGQNGGIVQPAPNRGMPEIPSGLPTQGPLEGTDTVYPPVPHHIDVYRYPTQKQANAATRVVPVTIYIPKGTNAKCPK
jgi:hypothetical protein